MSRIGKMPIPLPSGVQVRIDGSHVTVKGPKGELSRELDPDLSIQLADGQLIVSRPSDQPRQRAMHGLTRSLLANMVAGVSEGFTKTLELQGVGYRVHKQGDNLLLSVGLTGRKGRPQIEVIPPPGISFEVEGTNRIFVTGISKELVGQVAADIRAVRPPEPYKGKGIRYAGEYVRRKAGKAGKATR